jgi:hypothetical protein
MSAVIFQSRTEWNDYFYGTSPTKYSSQLFTSRQTPSNTYVYISNCLFRSFTSGNTGGALYLGSTTYLLIESTSFFSCKTSSGSGGAIYFSYSSGQCVFNEVCGYDCCTTGGCYNFAYIGVNNGVSSKNYVNYSSIIRCINPTTSCLCNPLRLENGKICCPSVNISMNKVCHFSGIMCYPYGDSNTVTCSLTYTTFADNIANSYTCIYLGIYSAKYEIKSCNILRNTQSSSSYGTICTYGKLMIEYSCILGNTANYIFYIESYTITLSNCTVDSTSNNGYLTTQNTVTKSFILALNHMSTRNCNSEYDSVGTLAPIIQTPSPSKRQIHLCTCGIMFYHPQGSIGAFASILVFNFIHSGSYFY